LEDEVESGNLASGSERPPAWRESRKEFLFSAFVISALLRLRADGKKKLKGGSGATARVPAA
jgi:hypothetical protein